MSGVRTLLWGWAGLLAILALACRQPGTVPPPVPQMFAPAFDPEAIAEGRPPRLGSLPPLEVRDYEPEGPSDGSRIRVRFNQPVADMTRPEGERSPVGLSMRALRSADPDEAGEQGRVVPSRSEWARPDTLELSPRGELSLATRYEVVLPAGLRNRDGSQLGAVRWRFETARPQARLLADDEPTLASAPIYVLVDQPVEPAELRRHLHVQLPARTGALPTDVPYELRRLEPDETLPEPWVWYDERPAPEDSDEADEKGPWVWAVTPTRAWPHGSTGTLRIDAGLTGSWGPLPLAEAYEGPIEIRDRLRVKEVDCFRKRGDICEPGHLDIVLTSPVSDEALEKLRVSPRPADLEVWGRHDDAGMVVNLDGDFRAGRYYTLTLPGSLTDEYGQRLGRRWRKRIGVRPAGPVKEEPGEPAVWLSSREGTFLRPSDAKIGVLAEHVEQVRVRLLVLDDEARGRVLTHDRLAEAPWPAGDTTTVLQTFETRGVHARAEHVLDLSRYAGLGDAVLVEVEAAALTPKALAEDEAPSVRGIFQISDIGAVVDVGPAKSLVRATRASSAEPWRGLAVALHTAEGERELGETDVAGLKWAPGAESLGDDAWVLLGERGGADRVALPLRDFEWPASHGVAPGAHYMAWERSRRRRPEPPPELPPGLHRGERALLGVQLGRGLYLPGDTVHLAGWAGISTPHRSIATRRVPVGTAVVVELQQGERVVASRRTTVDARGRFVSSLPLPPEAPLGLYVARARMLGSTNVAPFVLADARIPTFEVAAVVKDDWVRGQVAEARVDARYLSGEPTPIEDLQWQLSCRTTRYRPADFGWRWQFGADYEHDTVYRTGHQRGGKRPPSQRTIELQTQDLDPMTTHWCGLSVAVQDASLQQNGADTDYTVHPATRYVGLRTPRDAVAGKSQQIQVVAVDLEGQRVAQSAVEVVVERVPRSEGNTPGTPVEVARCTVDLAAEGEFGECALRRPRAGDYRVRATTAVGDVPIRADADFVIEPPPKRSPRRRRTSVSSQGPSPSGSTTERERSFEIHAPRQAPAGKPVELRIEGPWESAHGVLTVEQTGLRAAEPFVLEGGEAVVEVTPRLGQGPQLGLRASVTTPEGERALPRVHQTRAHIELREDRALHVNVKAPQTAAPGSEVSLRIEVTDDAGKALDATLAVWVVDDGVHQLRRPYAPTLGVMFNPYRERMHQRSRTYDVLRRPFVPWGFRGRGKRVPHVRQAKASVKGAGPEAEVRQRFEAVPLFVGNVGTGPDGVVKLPLSLPDNLTRFRVTAVASAELPTRVGGRSGPARFGRAEAEIEVSAPLMVRTVLPRVLRPGDEATLGALVTTPEGKAGTLVVEIDRGRGPSPLRWQGDTKLRRRVDGHGPTRVDFGVRALRPGEPRVRMRARFTPDGGGAKLRAAVERELRVEVERTAVEHAAIYGRLDHDDPLGIPVRLPDDVRPDFGELTVTLRSTALGDLDEAVQYLEDYPYGCVEQTASRLLPLVALGDLGDRLPQGAGDPAARWAETLDYLLTMQRDDGRFTYWPRGTTVAGYAGAYATWVLQLAVDAGRPVPPSALRRSLEALQQRLAEPAPSSTWERELWRAERALVVHTLVHAGRNDATGLREALDSLLDDQTSLPLFAQAMLLMTAHRVEPRDERVEVLRRRISSSIEELPGTAHPTERTDDRYAALFDSTARSHAMVLIAWLQLSPEDPLVDKLARGLRLRREGGRWRNTQENAYALLAMAAYARAREAVVPDHRIGAWVGPTALGQVEQRGRDTAARQLRVAMSDLLGPLDDERTTMVVLDREGQGAAHYRLGLRWTPAGDAPARSQGLSLRRTIVQRGEPVDGPLHAGERYVVRVVVDTDAPQRYLAMEVPLPAGLEAIDTGLGAGAAARSGSSVSRGWWVSHQELHRDRVLVFADELPPGVHVHEVPVLATTPGRFVLPAATAEAMYAPEVRARTTGTRLRVEPRR